VVLSTVVTAARPTNQQVFASNTINTQTGLTNKMFKNGHLGKTFVETDAICWYYQAIRISAVAEEMIFAASLCARCDTESTSLGWSE
jgi:hypothetical protein